MARFVHAADLHLGRRLHHVPLLEDQQHALEQLHALVDSERPDALLLAGDIYDRSIPPADAVAVLDSFLHRVVRGLGVPVVLIAGNHDSPDRLGFGARLLGAEGLHIRGLLEATPRPVVLHDQHGPIEVFALPFLEPARVRSLLEDDTVTDQQSAMAAMLARIRDVATAPRQLLVAHAFVDGGLASDSERPLSIGGAELVGAALFEDFAYVALGHLHRPQKVGLGRPSAAKAGEVRADGDRAAAAQRRLTPIHYAGSLLKYSLNEIEQPKSFTVVDIDAEGAATVRRHPIVARRDLRRVQGTLAELVAAGPQGNADDYVVATLLDRGPVFDAMAKLRTVYPNTLHIERPQLALPTQLRGPGQDHAQLEIRDLFASFFEQITGQAMSEDETTALAEVLDQMRQDEVSA